MQVEQILQQKGGSVVSLPQSVSLDAAAKALATKRIGAVILRNDAGALAGILSERDVVRALAGDSAAVLDKPASDFMTRNVVTCRKADSVEGLMAIMTEGRFRHLPVLDEDGRLAGIISIGDVVKAHIEETAREASHLRQFIAEAG